MNHKLRGASHLALIATLAVTLGASTITLAGSAVPIGRTPVTDGSWIGGVCSEEPGAGRTCAECVGVKCAGFYPVAGADRDLCIDTGSLICAFPF